MFTQQKLVVCVLSFLVLSLFSLKAELPNPGNGGKDGKPIDLLFLKGNVEIGFGQPMELDKKYIEMLKKEGFNITVARDFNPLTLDYLKQFNTVVWINPSPCYAYSRYISPASWQGGLHMLTVQKNDEILRKYVQDGGGLLIDVAVEEIGMAVISSHKKLLKKYGIDVECAQVRDKKHEFEFDKIANRYPLYVSWTENIKKHEATKEVKRIYYPAFTMRWDDNVTTLPLYPKDDAWKVLVEGMPSSTASWYRGTPYENGHWKDAENLPTPVLAAVRDYGKGRIGMISICHFHLFYYPFSDKKRHHECYFGPQKGNFVQNGFEGVPSDTVKLLDNMYCWLAAPGVKLGLGGYDAENGVKIKAIPEQPVANLAEVWADKDPAVTGKIRPMKILVGAHTAKGGGKGSVANYAEKGKKAGYDVIVFTESYENMTDSDFVKTVEQCRKNSDKDIYLMPGIEVEDAYGNAFLIIGKDSPVRAHLRVNNENEKPGNKLIWTGHMLIGMGEVVPAVSRPEKTAEKSGRGKLPHDLYSHCPGTVLATYKNGKKVDNGLDAYKWQAFNASVPIPLAVHEVYSPDELKKASETGLQNYVNTDTPERAALYFKQGHMSVGGNPMRYYVSSGPIVDSAGINDWQNPNWEITVKAHDKNKITDLKVHDQRGIYRSFKPDSKKIDISWAGDLAIQHWFLVQLIDEKGNEAWLSPIRTLPDRSYMRCTDRQNWFSGMNFRYLTYTGRMNKLPRTGIRFDLPGVNMPSKPAPKLQLSYAGPEIVVSEYILDSSLVPGTDPGCDSAPIFNVIDNEFFTGRIKHYFNMSPGKKGYHPTLIHGFMDIELKKDMPTKGKIWPVTAQLLATKPGVEYTYPDPETGKIITKKLKKGEYVDLPAGGCIKHFMTLTPQRLSPNGKIGFANIAETAKKGTEYHMEYLYIDKSLAAEAIREMGFNKEKPSFEIDLSQGKKETFKAEFSAKSAHFGIAGNIEVNSKSKWWNDKRLMPISVSGLNKNWPLGLWRPGAEKIKQYGMIDSKGYGHLNVTKSGEFYFGNLLIASNPDIKLSFTAPWTESKAVVEVHNPTDKAINCTVRSPEIIKNKIKINQEVSILPGQSKILTIEK